MPIVGVFPLNIVLFPASSYPLHIFEDRYKELIGNCIVNNQEFGINLVDSSRMFQTGCLARIEEVTKRYEDGCMDIVVTGTRRYRISDLDDKSKAYYTADVATFDDNDATADYQLLGSSITLYNQIVEAVYGDAEDRLDPADWIHGMASFRMAQKAGMELAIRQQLLEMVSENERLRFIRKHLQEVLPKIRQVEQVRQVSRNDGYLKL